MERDLRMIELTGDRHRCFVEPEYHRTHSGSGTPSSGREWGAPETGTRQAEEAAEVNPEADGESKTAVKKDSRTKVSFQCLAE